MAKQFITNNKITKEFLDFFSQTRRYNLASAATIQGLIPRLQAAQSTEDLEELSATRRHVDTMLFSYLLDNFQTYLSDITLALFNHRPEVLSGGSIKNAIVFESPDLDSLKRRIIDKTVLDLGYKNIVDIDKYFRENFKFAITETWLETRRLARLVQIRNIIAHNRSIINNTFMAKVGSKFDKIGEPVLIPNLRATDRYLINLAQKIDRRAIDNFDLPNFG